MDATSLGESEAISRSMPSTITNGLLPFQLDRPRRRIDVWESISPGAPLEEMTDMPDTLPAKAFLRLVVPESTSSSPFTCEMAPITDSFFCTPYPTTTMSSMTLVSSCNVIIHSVCASIAFPREHSQQKKFGVWFRAGLRK